MSQPITPQTLVNIPPKPDSNLALLDLLIPIYTLQKQCPQRQPGPTDLRSDGARYFDPDTPQFHQYQAAMQHFCVCLGSWSGSSGGRLVAFVPFPNGDIGGLTVVLEPTDADPTRWSVLLPSAYGQDLIRHNRWLVDVLQEIRDRIAQTT